MLIVYCTKNCRVIRKGVQVDIQKCLVEGKPVIIEGVGIRPELYIEEQGTQGQPKQAELDETDQAVATFIQQYISNEIRVKKFQRKDQNLFNWPN